MVDQQKLPMAQLLRALTAPAVPKKHPMVLRHLTVAAAALHMVAAVHHMAAVSLMEAKLLTVLHTSTPTTQLLTAIQQALMVVTVTGLERIMSMSLLLSNTLK